MPPKKLGATAGKGKKVLAKAGEATMIPSSTAVPTSQQPHTTALDISLARKAVAALFTYEAKKEETSTRSLLIEDYAKPVIAQIQLIKGSVQLRNLHFLDT